MPALSTNGCKWADKIGEAKQPAPVEGRLLGAARLGSNLNNNHSGIRLHVFGKQRQRFSHLGYVQKRCAVWALGLHLAAPLHGPAVIKLLQFMCHNTLNIEPSTQPARGADPMLRWCWADVEDGGQDHLNIASHVTVPYYVENLQSFYIILPPLYETHSKTNRLVYTLHSKGKGQYLLTCKVRRYCLLALHGSTSIKSFFRVQQDDSCILVHKRFVLSLFFTITSMHHDHIWYTNRFL